MRFWILMACLILGSAYVLSRVDAGRDDPEWRPSRALKYAALILAAAWQLLRAWYVLLGAFFGVVMVVAAYRLGADGAMFEAAAFGALGVLALSVSFRWFAMHDEWRHPQPAPSQARRATQLLRNLQDAGFVIGEPLPVEFTLLFDSEEAARKAAPMCGTPTLTARVSHGGNDWAVGVAGTIILTPSALDEHNARFEVIASSLGGAYCGWELADVEDRAG